MESDYQMIGSGNMQLKVQMQENIPGEMNLMKIEYLYRVYKMIDLLHPM